MQLMVKIKDFIIIIILLVYIRYYSALSYTVCAYPILLLPYSAHACSVLLGTALFFLGVSYTTLSSPILLVRILYYSELSYTAGA